MKAWRSDPAQNWPVVDPEWAGIRPNIVEKLDQGVIAGDFPGLHGLLIVRNKSLAVERYYEGLDERWGLPLGVVKHGPGDLHDIRSITKSVVSLLYGIALGDRLVPPPGARLMEQFPEYPDLGTDPERRKIRMSHALSMQLGIAWHEDRNYSDPANDELRMEAARERYRHILERPLLERPGTRWNYCGGATALLGRLIAKGTGRQLEDYARASLFKPLGITDLEWVRGWDGEASASSGLRMRGRDLARIGQLILNRGQWEGMEIVGRNWLRQCFTARAKVERGLHYGYQWWLGRLISNGKPWYGAFGNGGQRLLIIPSLDMVVVIQAGNYNKEDQWKMPSRLMSKIVIASLSPDDRRKT